MLKSENYEQSVLENVQALLDKYSISSVEEFSKKLDDINAYENLTTLQPINEKDVHLISDEVQEAEEAVLAGNVLWELHAAGEGTRLKLGTKYLIKPSTFSLEKIASLMNNECEEEGKEARHTAESVLKEVGCELKELLDVSLGERQILQLLFDITKLAKKYGKDNKEVLRNQTVLLVLNEECGEEVRTRWKEKNCFGLNKNNVFFMIQKNFHGIDILNGKAFFDVSSPRRVHNHGQLMLQKTLPGVIRNGLDVPIVFSDVLSKHHLLVSYNVEGMDRLIKAVDLPALHHALQLGKEGHNMVMRVVAQTLEKPQKGGACFFDRKKGKPVMIESFQLKGIKNEEITHLNKNQNYYPHPIRSFLRVKEGGLPAPFTIKDGRIYACPVGGDINFLVKTAFVMKKEKEQNRGWKSPATTPLAFHMMKLQDEQEGFKEFVSSIEK